jgi:Na+-driven multidrug efflux pump
MKNQTYLKGFARYSILNVMGMLGLSCYILADTYFISKGLGANGLAALNLAIPVYCFINGSCLMLGIGGAIKYSILKGQKSFEKSNRLFTNTVYATAILAAVFMLIVFFLSEEVTLLLGADTEVFAMTNTYLKVMLLFAPAFMMNTILICFVRNDGNPKLAMFAMIGGSFSRTIDFPTKRFVYYCTFGVSAVFISRHYGCMVSISSYRRIGCSILFDTLSQILIA